MNYKDSMISIALASLLVGCGSSDKPKETQNPNSSPTTSKVCLDVNMNAICDAGETFKEVPVWDGNGDTKIAVDASLTGSPLAYNGVNGYIFTAPAGSTDIYAGTTMKNNELIYNQIIEEKTGALAKAYVHPHFASGAPSSANKKAIADAVKANIKAHPNESRYAVIAAVMNKLFAASSAPADIAGISVTAEDIVSADVPSLAVVNIALDFDKDILSDIEAMNTDSSQKWKDAKDTEFRYLSSKNGKLIGGTKEHNGLAVVDMSEKTISFTPVSVITDAAHHERSSSVDAQSGPSEPSMKGAVLTSDGASVYFNVPSKTDESNVNILGLFKADIAADGSISTDTTTLPNGSGEIIVTDGKRLNNKTVKKFSLANDDSKVVVYDSDKNLYLYDANLENILGQTDDVSVENITAIAASKTNVFTASKDSNEITIRGVTDALAPTATIDIGFSAHGIVINSDATMMAAFTKGHDNNGVTNIAIVDLSNNEVMNSGETAFISDGVAFSPNFKKAVLFGHEEDATKILNLDVKGFGVEGLYAQGARAATFVDNDKLAITDGDKTISLIDVTTTTKNLNLARKIELAKNGLNKDSINAGGYLDAVIKDISLNPTYENINIAWSESGLSTNIVLPEGNVTRGASDVVGTLTASLSATFRDANENGNKDLNITIRKDSPTTDVTSTLDLNNNFRGGYMSVGANGKVVSVNKDGDEGGIYILNSDDTTLSFYVGDMNASNDNETYHKFGEKEDGLAVAYTKKDQVVAVTNIGNIYRYTINGENTITETQKITLATGMTPKSAVFNSTSTKLAVLISDASANYTTKIYDIAVDGTVTLNSDVAMEKLVYDSEIAIKDDASVIYTRSEGDVVNAQEGTTHTSHTINEKIRGLFYVNDTLYSTDSIGKLRVFAGGDLSSYTEHTVGHNGRGYMIKEAGDKLYIFLYSGRDTIDGGVSIVNKTTLEEERFIPAKKAYRGAVSADGKDVYFFSYDKAPRSLNFTRLP